MSFPPAALRACFEKEGTSFCSRGMRTTVGSAAGSIIAALMPDASNDAV
jgi:hypothetical protein